jgi:hypothetical protein
MAHLYPDPGTVAINYIGCASLSVAMPMISREFNISPAIQGLLLSGFFWSYCAMQIPGGMLADRFLPRGHRRRNDRLGWFRRARRGRHWLDHHAADPGWFWLGRGPDLPGWCEADRHVDDAHRAGSGSGTFGWRRAIGNRVGI